MEGMTLALLALVAGVVVGLVRGGGFARLLTVRLRRNRLLLTAVGLHVLGVLVGWLWAPAMPTLVALSWAVLGYYAWVNRAVEGAALVAAGLLANAVVMFANGAVPVSMEAAARAGADPTVVAAAGNNIAIGPETRLTWLGKVVPVAFPPRPEVVSPGDIAIAAGLAAAVSTGLLGRRGPSRAADVPDDQKHPAIDRDDEALGGDETAGETMEPDAEPQRFAG